MEGDVKKAVLNIDDSQCPITRKYARQWKARLHGTHVLNDLIDCSAVVEKPPPVLAGFFNNKDRGVPRAI